MDPPSASPVTYTWDDNGNLTARGSDSFVWDAEDRTTSATVSSVTTTFAYNGDGLRDSLTVNSNTTTFTWDMNTSVPQVLDDGDFRYVYGLGRISQVAANTYYYLADGLGSTMALTDDTGAVVNTYDYGVFGAKRASTGNQDNDFTFAGEQVDESTGLQYLRARYYDEETGGFASRDPLVDLTNDPFAYASNCPTRYLDSTGLTTTESDFHCVGVGSARGQVYRFETDENARGVADPPQPFSVSASAVIQTNGSIAAVYFGGSTTLPDTLTTVFYLSTGAGTVELGRGDSGLTSYQVPRNLRPSKVTVRVIPKLSIAAVDLVVRVGGLDLTWWKSLLRVFGGVDAFSNTFSFDLDCHDIPLR